MINSYLNSSPVRTLNGFSFGSFAFSRIKHSGRNGDLMRAGIIVGAVALAAFDKPLFAGAALAGMGYERIEKRGWVPQKVSLFVKSYLPKLIFFNMFLGMGYKMRALAIVVLTITQASKYQSILQKMDLLFHQIFRTKSPTLKDIYTPVVERKKLSYNEIKTILAARPDTFTLNYAHCSKWGVDPDKLSEDNQYEIQLKQNLQRSRKLLVDEACKEFAALFARLSLPQVVVDHISKLKYPYFAYGFLPLSKKESDSVNLIMWEGDSWARKQMCEDYFWSLDTEAAQLPNFKDYLEAILKQNDRLSDAERQEILEIYRKTSEKATDPRFYRLTFVMLGILNTSKLRCENAG